VYYGCISIMAMDIGKTVNRIYLRANFHNSAYSIALSCTVHTAGLICYASMTPIMDLVYKHLQANL